MLQLLSKIIFIILFTFFPGDNYRWLLVIVLVTLSTLIFYKMRHERPYYNENVADVSEIAAKFALDLEYSHCALYVDQYCSFFSHAFRKQ